MTHPGLARIDSIFPINYPSLPLHELEGTVLLSNFDTLTTNAKTMEETKNIDEAGAGPSKKAAKKAEAKAKKEALKAQRAAERAATAVADVDLEDDPAQDNYGRSTNPTFSSDAEEVELRSLDESHDGKTVVVRAWLQNSRIQSAKMGFVELRKGGNWTIQGIAMATIAGTGAETQMPAEGTPLISRRMVKWIAAISPESFIAVEAKVKRPLEPVKSCRISTLELHITKCFVLAPAPAMLGMTMAAASQPVVNFSDEEPAAAQKESEEKEKESTHHPQTDATDRRKSPFESLHLGASISTRLVH